MTTFYFVALTNPDDTPSEVDIGGAITENGAAHLALKVIGVWKRDMCVIGINATTGHKKVLQIIRYKNEVVAREERRIGERRHIADRRTK